MDNSKKPELIRWARWTIPMRYSAGSGAISLREGIVIEWLLPGGERTWSEAAPLPGWSQESLEDCIRCLEQGEEERLSAPAAIRFAVEGAALGMGGAGELPHPVAAQALISADQTMRLRMESLQRFSSVKIKAGPENFRQVLSLAAEFAGVKKIRIDANETVELKMWREAPTAVLRSLDYIEDPCPPEELGSFLEWAAAQGVAVAKDATTPRSAREFWRSGGRVVVAKPMVWGGFRELTAMRDEAASFGGRLVVSSALESSIGRVILIRKLSALAWKEASGICTGFVFGGDALADRGVYAGSLTMEPEKNLWWKDLEWIER